MDADHMDNRFNAILDTEDAQLMAELREQMKGASNRSPYQYVADVLDPRNADADDLTSVVVKGPEERRLLLLYAKLGRNHWYRNIKPDEQDGES